MLKTTGLQPMLILAPNTFVIGQNLMLPDEDIEIENKDWC